jgi:peptidoglycan/xylan/chitin deacetylase (PgdA/CDA1 family)
MNLKQVSYRAISQAYGVVVPRNTKGWRALLYHSIGRPLTGDPYGLALSAEIFDEQMSRLRMPIVFGPTRARDVGIAVTFDDGFRDTLRAAAPILQKWKIPATVFVTSGLVGKEPYLSMAELKELASLSGITIGAHGADHRPLTALSDADLADELSFSRKRLEDWIGRPVKALSYPHGDVDRRVREAAQKAGYEIGGCSRYGLNDPSRDPLLLCRTEITAFDSLSDFALKISGAWDWFRFRHGDPARSL